MKRFAAALTLFTRLPLWRWTDIPAGAYSSAVVFWPLTGWLTGGITALVYLGMSYLTPTMPALVTAIVARLLFTGALHEDGLADFCDGFGGGGEKERILAIMKDSHIGTYGVIALICYFMLFVSLLYSLAPVAAALAIFAADPFSKFCTSQITNVLPYARKEGAKNKISYQRMTSPQLLCNFLCGTLPLVPLFLYYKYSLTAVILPVLTLLGLVYFMKRRIGGYTGDCCGAAFLICEVMMISGIVMMFGFRL